MTDELCRELEKVRHWKMSGYGIQASFSAWAIRADHRAFARVRVRRQKQETIEAMIWRGLAELNRRLLDGMPKPKPELIARRKLRDAPSASKFTN